jgi:uncharacterized protein with von Willebrand factor type A (vWA) domain
MRTRYERWSGTQQPLAEGVDAGEVLDDLGEELLSGTEPDRALSQLLQRGAGDRPGLDELRRRVEQARRRELARLGVGDALSQVAAELDDIVARERYALAAEAGRGGELDDAPGDVAGRLSALADHDWADADAEADFAALRQRLRRDVAEATFGQLAGALGCASPADLERLAAMLGELNAMLAERQRGGEPDFDGFMARYGDLVPGQAQSLDELVEELARRLAAMSRLMASLDADQRYQLTELAEQALGDVDLAWQASQLADALARAHPELAWGQPSDAPMAGDQLAGSISSTVDWLEHLQAYEDLGRALRQDYPGARLEDVDPEALHELVGPEAAEDLARLRQTERALERAGMAQRRQGRLQLTPRGVRRLGQRSLSRIYGAQAGLRPGGHRAHDTGGSGEPTGAVRPWRFGDALRLDVSATVGNAVRRGAGGPPIELTGDDFAVAEAQQRVRAATVLLLDMSFSMPLRGNWVPAKTVALALQALIEDQYPADAFHIVGFSDYARRLRPTDLVGAGWERVYGTNMEHAFRLARRLLRADPEARPRVLMVTDGEPTAHLEGGEPRFAWPPQPQTLRHTLAEAQRLAGVGATLNVFVLDHEPGAAQFVEQMARQVGGRVLYPNLDDLGSVVVRDFLRQRRG